MGTVETPTGTSGGDRRRPAAPRLWSLELSRKTKPTNQSQSRICDPLYPYFCRTPHFSLHWCALRLIFCVCGIASFFPSTGLTQIKTSTEKRKDDNFLIFHPLTVLPPAAVTPHFTSTVSSAHNNRQHGSRPYQDRQEVRQGHHRAVLSPPHPRLRDQQASLRRDRHHLLQASPKQGQQIERRVAPRWRPDCTVGGIAIAIANTVAVAIPRKAYGRNGG